jgi:hypothetical protein
MTPRPALRRGCWSTGDEALCPCASEARARESARAPTRRAARRGRSPRSAGPCGSVPGATLARRDRSKAGERAPRVDQRGLRVWGSAGLVLRRLRCAEPSSSAQRANLGNGGGRAGREASEFVACEVSGRPGYRASGERLDFSHCGASSTRVNLSSASQASPPRAAERCTGSQSRAVERVGRCRGACQIAALGWPGESQVRQA